MQIYTAVPSPTLYSVAAGAGFLPRLNNIVNLVGLVAANKFNLGDDLHSIFYYLLNQPLGENVNEQATAKSTKRIANVSLDISLNCFFTKILKASFLLFLFGFCIVTTLLVVEANPRVHPLKIKSKL